MPVKRKASLSVSRDLDSRKDFLVFLKKHRPKGSAQMQKELLRICGSDSDTASFRARKTSSSCQDVTLKGLDLLGWREEDVRLFFSSFPFHRVRSFSILQHCTLRPNPEHEGKPVFCWSDLHEGFADLFLFAGGASEPMHASRWLQSSFGTHLLSVIAFSSEDVFHSAVQDVLSTKASSWKHRVASVCASDHLSPWLFFLRVLYFSPVTAFDADWQKGFVRVLCGTYALSSEDAEEAVRVMERVFLDAGLKSDPRTFFLLFQQQIHALTVCFRRHLLSRLVSHYAPRPGLCSFLHRFLDLAFSTEGSLDLSASLDRFSDSDLSSVLLPFESLASDCTDPFVVPEFSTVISSLRFLNRRWPRLSSSDKHVFFSLIHSV